MMEVKRIIKVSVLVFGIIFILFPSSAVSEEYIQIGAPLPLTGYFAGDGILYLNGIQMAVDEINEKGGVLGKKIKIIKFDTQDFAPEIVMRAADQLIGKEKVVAIHAAWAGWGQDVQAYGKYDVPTFLLDASIFSIQAYQEDPKKYHNIFQLTDVLTPQYKAQFDMMTEMLPYEYASKTLAMVTADDNLGEEVRVAIGQRAEEKGWDVIVNEKVPYGTTDWAPILTKIKRANPGWIYFDVISVPDTVTFVRQFLKTPPNSLLHVGYIANMLDFPPNIGKDGDGLLGFRTALPGPDLPDATTEQWAASYRKKYNLEPTGSSLYTYDGIMIWAKAVEAVGDVNKYKDINDYISNNPHEGIMYGGKKARFDQDHKIAHEYVPTNLSQMWDSEFYGLYIAGGEKYKYDFKSPPWIK